MFLPCKAKITTTKNKVSHINFFKRCQNVTIVYIWIWDSWFDHTIHILSFTKPDIYHCSNVSYWQDIYVSHTEKSERVKLVSPLSKSIIYIVEFPDNSNLILLCQYNVTSYLPWGYVTVFWHYIAVQNIITITRRRTNAGLMLAQRLRRWANIKPTFAQRLVVVRIPYFVIQHESSYSCSIIPPSKTPLHYLPLVYRESTAQLSSHITEFSFALFYQSRRSVNRGDIFCIASSSGITSLCNNNVVVTAVLRTTRANKKNKKGWYVNVPSTISPARISHRIGNISYAHTFKM